MQGAFLSRPTPLPLPPCPALAGFLYQGQAVPWGHLRMSRDILGCHELGVLLARMPLNTQSQQCRA